MFLSVSNHKININGRYWREYIPNSDANNFVLFNRANIEYNVEQFKNITNKVFPKCICTFALKVAPHNEVLGAVKNKFGVEVYNLSELTTALKAKCSPIVVNGYYKPYLFLKECIENDVFIINVDSYDEIRIINSIAKKMGKRVNVGIRIKKNENSKMGVSITEIRECIAEIKAYTEINIIAVHMHPGSNIQNFLKTKPMYDNLLMALEVLVENNFDIKYVNIGGGYGEFSCMGKNLEEYLYKIKHLFCKFDNITFILEPGRVLVADAGILFTKVVSVNHYDKIINVAIALSPFLCTTNATLDLDFPDHVMLNEQCDYSIAGIWPISNDIIKKERIHCTVPKSIKSGDYLVIYNAGAYVLDRLDEYSFEKIEVEFLDEKTDM